MAGVLREVSKLSWPTETGPHITQKVVIIADAPPHGKNTIHLMCLTISQAGAH